MGRGRTGAEGVFDSYIALFETYSHCSAARGRGPRDLHGQSTDRSHAGDTASVSMNPIRTKSNTKSQLTRQCECPEGRREVCYTCNCTFTESIGIEGVGAYGSMDEDSVLEIKK